MCIRDSPGPERRSTERTLHMVYHGRMDRNRGVLALPMVHQKAKNAGLDVTLTLMGEGDALGALKRMERDVSVFVEGKRSARRYADDHLGWTHSVEALHTAIEGSVGETVPKEKVVPGFGETPSPEPPTSAPLVEEAPELEPPEAEPVEVQPPVPEPTPEPEPIEEPPGPRRKM